MNTISCSKVNSAFPHTEEQSFIIHPLFQTYRSDKPIVSGNLFCDGSLYLVWNHAIYNCLWHRNARRGINTHPSISKTSVCDGLDAFTPAVIRISGPKWWEIEHDALKMRHLRLLNENLGAELNVLKWFKTKDAQFWLFCFALLHNTF